MIVPFKVRVMELLEEYLRVSAIKDLAYAERNKCVACLVALAKMQGWRCGLGLHDPMDAAWEADYRNIVFVDLPTGQVSWHIHDDQLPLFAGLGYYEPGWDKHSTAEKYGRLEAFVRSVMAPA